MIGYSQEKKYITINVDNIIEHLEITNSTGQIVFTQKQINSNNITIQLDDFSKGIYIIQIKTNNQLTLKKFIVE